LTVIRVLAARREPRPPEGCVTGVFGGGEAPAEPNRPSRRRVRER
jgi:hypothetical protein